METINERCRSDITAAFTGLDGLPSTPASVKYSTRCLTTGAAIKTDVVVSPASSVTITLDAEDNAIRTPANPFEFKVLTVKATYGVNDECNAEYTYRVKNLVNA